MKTSKIKSPECVGVTRYQMFDLRAQSLGISISVRTHPVGIDGGILEWKGQTDGNGGKTFFAAKRPIFLGEYSTTLGS